jgi:DNA-directed RNA polymerase specialized sigma24 family protein
VPVGEISEPVAEASADPGLWAQVASLPDKQRTAVALRFLADAPYAEIGSVMDTSEEAARRNVHEGLKRLRREHRS